MNERHTRPGDLDDDDLPFVFSRAPERPKPPRRTWSLHTAVLFAVWAVVFLACVNIVTIVGWLHGWLR